MKKTNKRKLGSSITEAQAGELISQLLQQLEFVVNFIDRNTRQGVPDFLAKKQIGLNKEYRIAIEVKTMNNIHDAIRSGTRTLEQAKLNSSFDKLLLILSSRSSNGYEEIIKFREKKRDNPTEVEIIDLNELEDWADSLRTEFGTEEFDEVQILIRKISREFISLIAKNPEYLMSLEWRDLERTIKELFSELGFDATLTPGSKDGGKDVILECEIGNEKKSFIVEIKHWRSKKRVGKKAVKEFTQVVINEKKDKGLYLSTYGYTQNYLESLTEIERSMVKFGEENKIVELCTTYEKIKNGIWVPIVSMEDLLFQNTK